MNYNNRMERRMDIILSDITTGWFNLIRKELGILPSHLDNKATNRLHTCASCQWRDNNTCLKCGCFLKAKVLSDSKCPLNFWKD